MTITYPNTKYVKNIFIMYLSFFFQLLRNSYVCNVNELFFMALLFFCFRVWLVLYKELNFCTDIFENNFQLFAVLFF